MFSVKFLSKVINFNIRRNLAVTVLIIFYIYTFIFSFFTIILIFYIYFLKNQ